MEEILDTRSSTKSTVLYLCGAEVADDWKTSVVVISVVALALVVKMMVALVALMVLKEVASDVLVEVKPL